MLFSEAAKHLFCSFCFSRFIEDWHGVNHVITFMFLLFIFSLCLARAFKVPFNSHPEIRSKNKYLERFIIIEPTFTGKKAKNCFILSTIVSLICIAFKGTLKAPITMTSNLFQ